MGGAKSSPAAAHLALSETFCVHSSHYEPLCATLGTSEEFLTAWADSGCDPAAFAWPQNYISVIRKLKNVTYSPL